MECPFCNIDLERTRILKEGNFTRVIFSNPRLMTGHLLVIPKRHLKKISELNKNEKKELFDTLIEFQEKILNKISLGCDIRQNYRPFQEQDKFKIHHLHFHLQPRELFDELYKRSQIFEKEIFKDLPKEELERMKRILE